METVTSELQMISEIETWLDYAHSNTIRVTDPLQLPNVYGYYCILSNKPVPPFARTHKDAENIKHDGKYLWRDGAGNIRNTIANRHLFRKEEDRRDGKKPNAMKVNIMPVNLFTNRGNTNYTECTDSIFAWENGINMNDPMWLRYEFFVAYYPCGLFVNAMEQIAKDYIGYPPLNLQKKK